MGYAVKYEVYGYLQVLDKELFLAGGLMLIHVHT
jgi:hypothetical protein